MSLAQLLEDGSPVMDLAERFRVAGHSLYLVGGPVRDAFLGRPSLDLDFATDAEPETTVKIVEPVAAAVWLQGIKYGTVGARIDDTPVEITTFRTEKYQPSSRHPKVKFAPDIETDLARRDFTVNAMAVRLPDRSPVDPYGGLQDLKDKYLRTPMDPHDSFGDDPLRMLRAFRFASQLDFKIDKQVLEAITEMREELKTISAERIRDELSKLICGSAPARALRLADSTGITELFLPELVELKLEQDPVHRHKDVFQHTLAVVERTDPILELRLAALLHDIGKPKTRRFTPEGVTFHHHEVVGAKMAARRLEELRYPNEVVETVRTLIFLHHRFYGYGQTDRWTDSAVRRYVRDAGDRLKLLNALIRADCTTRDQAKARMLSLLIDDLEERIERLEEEEEISRIRPELDGRRVMEHLGIEPGPLVGEALDFLLEIRLEEGLIGEQEAYRRLDGWAKDKGIGTR